MQIIKKLRKQRGSITLLGIGSIVLSLFAFNQVTEFANAKILDRELDNYALDLATVALRSELAITKEGIDTGAMSVTQTTTTVNEILGMAKQYTSGYKNKEGEEPKEVNLAAKITFGNFDKDGAFVPLESDSNNPKAAKEPPDFSAVALQLTSSHNFHSYVPQGKAIYGLGFNCPVLK
jgi:hypothetical protein